MKEFSWEKEKRLERVKQIKNTKLLKSQGWKVVKNDYDIPMVKHPEYGMTTIERALKGNFES